MIELEYKFTNDILFKMLFVKHPGLLKKLVATLLRIKLDSITAFKLFDCTEYHSEYQPLEVTRHTPLSDRMALHYFELPKLPENVTANNIRELWLSLLRSKTEEDLAKLEALEVSDMKQAIEAYRHITVTP